MPIDIEFFEEHFDSECAVYRWDDEMGGSVAINIYPSFNTFYLDWSDYNTDLL